MLAFEAVMTFSLHQLEHSSRGLYRALLRGCLPNRDLDTPMNATSSSAEQYKMGTSKAANILSIRLELLHLGWMRQISPGITIEVFRRGVFGLQSCKNEGSNPL
jgi:hypothetical protein